MAVHLFTKFRYIRWFLLVILSFTLSIGFSALPDSLFVVQAQTSELSIIQASTSPRALVQSAKTLYDGQRYAEANKQLDQAAQAFATLGDTISQAQTLALQSLALQKLGDWNEAQSVLDQSFALLVTINDAPARIQAQVFNVQGRLQLATGHTQAALNSWEAAEDNYAIADEFSGVIGSQINQIQALESLGLYHRAGQLLVGIESQLDQIPDSAIKVKGMLKLGNMLRLQGELQHARDYLNTGLTLAQSLNLSQLLSQFYLSLGTTEHIAAARASAVNTPAQDHFQTALDYYKRAAATAPALLNRTEAQLSELRLLTQPGLFGSLLQPQMDRIQSLIEEIQQTLPQLPPGRRAIYAQLNFVHSLMELTEDYQDAIAPILERAITQATTLQDKRAMAYATGTLGTWYETQQDWESAKDVTRMALQTAQSIQASDIAYQWQWQMGRIIQAEGDPPAAISYYSEAVHTLNALRSDLVALNPDIQFSFREQVEPVYRELVGLLLREQDSGQKQLRQARDVIESLQLAELDNFFRDACARPRAVNVETVDPNAAVVYPILLRDRLEVILQLPPGVAPGQLENESNRSNETTLLHFSHPLTEEAVSQTATDLQASLQLLSTSTGQIKTQSKQIYDWVIRPFESVLDTATAREESPIKTLAFVLDGPLRNLPMSVLYDGDHYLVERYAIALTPGLQLIDPQPLQRQTLNILLGGAENAPSFAATGLGPLDNVLRELNGIQTAIPTSQVLIDHLFLKDKIQQDLESITFNVVHFATHGKFSSDPEKTFILDWQQKISAQDMDRLLRINDPQRAVEKPIELLVLSACETAAGDSRAALGLAGLAIRAGARSTLATLWQVNDASTTEFMVRFYQELLNPKVTKADALRNVQLSFLRDNPRTRHNRPNRWAPFTLVGNWL